MSDSGQGPSLIFQNSEYRIESFFEGRPLTIWELRNPIFATKYIEAIFNMHTKSGVAEAIEAIKPKGSSRMGIEIAIEEWGPAVKTRIAKIRSQLNSADENHNKILNVVN